MKQAKCRECDCWSLTYTIKKKIKIRGYKTLLHTFTKMIEDKTNQNKNNNNNNNKENKTLNRRTQSKRRDQIPSP